VPFDSSKFTLGIAPYDLDKDDVLEVSNYATDIFQRLYFAEVRPSLVFIFCLVTHHVRSLFSELGIVITRRKHVLGYTWQIKRRLRQL
jgi:hypothetical protein